jgi:hypothetical protein
MARRRKQGKKPPHPKPTCKICSSTTGSWTEEDGYPKWLRKRIHEWIRALPAGVVEPGWEQGRRSLLKPVCQRCQRRLNEAFEVPAHKLIKEMIDGSVINLTPRQQVVVASWCAKSALVLVLARTLDPKLTEKPRVYLRYMLEHGTPPPNATVRIAYLSGGLEQSHRHFLPKGWPGALASYEIQHVLSTAGFVCETITSPGPILLPFIEATKDDDRFMVVWPPHITSQRWPPRIPLRLLDLEALREEWGHQEIHGNFPALTVPMPEKPH